MRIYRPGFAARLTLLLVASLIALQILLVMGFYIQRSNDTGGRIRMPLPDQVAAAAALLDKASPEQRILILRAMNSTQFHVRIAATPPRDNDAILMPFVTQTFKKNMHTDDHEVSVFLHRRRALVGSGWLPASRFTVVTKLRAGEFLIIETAAPFATILGFPPGFWAGVIGFGVVIVAILVIRREARPLRRLAEAADGLDLSEPKPIADFPSSAPEIRALISAFNRMQERIVGLIKTRMEVIGAFSHDVRTYATRLRLRAEHIADEAERTRAVRDIEDMISLVDDALVALQERTKENAQELVDVAELVEEEIGEQQRMGAAASFSAEASKDSALVIGSATGLRRVFQNLIENAVTYGGNVRATVAVVGERVLVTIDDSGPGIPPEWRAKVLQPFVRLEASRNRRTGGAGLGLPIATKIAEAHNGRVEIGEAPGGGARILVELPHFGIN